jgi:serine/threonine kinase 16
MVCFPSSPQLKINSRSFKILRLLGEVSTLLEY